jgi:hypothetical protein
MNKIKYIDEKNFFFFFGKIKYIKILLGKVNII